MISKLFKRIRVKNSRILSESQKNFVNWLNQPTGTVLDFTPENSLLSRTRKSGLWPNKLKFLSSQPGDLQLLTNTIKCLVGHSIIRQLTPVKEPIMENFGIETIQDTAYIMESEKLSLVAPHDPESSADVPVPIHHLFYSLPIGEAPLSELLKYACAVGRIWAGIENRLFTAAISQSEGMTRALPLEELTGLIKPSISLMKNHKDLSMMVAVMPHSLAESFTTFFESYVAEVAPQVFMLPTFIPDQELHELSVSGLLIPVFGSTKIAIYGRGPIWVNLTNLDGNYTSLNLKADLGLLFSGIRDITVFEPIAAQRRPITNG